MTSAWVARLLGINSEACSIPETGSVDLESITTEVSATYVLGQMRLTTTTSATNVAKIFPKRRRLTQSRFNICATVMSVILGMPESEPALFDHQNIVGPQGVTLGNRHLPQGACGVLALHLHPMQ